MLQRRNACYSAKLMMNQSYSESYANQISKVKSSDLEQALKIISERKKNESFEINPDVNRLVKQVKAVGGNVQGSVQARSKLRVNLHSLIYNRGLPHIFLTINPADTCNPVGLYICGVDIDFENVFNKFPSGYVRSQTIASHPVSTAKFFNFLIENIINALIMGGVLGPMDSYFGPVESQGRGSLHVHMLLWLLHKLKPKDIMEKISDPEFRTNLIKYLEDIVKETISEHSDEYNSDCLMPDIEKNESTNEIQPHLKYIKGDIPAACLFTPDPRDADYEQKFDQDVLNLVSETNIHRHNATCYKYAKLTDKRATCRMRFPRAKVEKSTIDPETGELKLKRTHEWLNNYNETIISACRCNMDIKYIFSGKDAKALCYYITDYVTKSSLSFYDIFSLIHEAVKISEEQSANNSDQNNDILDRSRKLILKCYNMIASKTELSGVQVASYLMSYKDHYTNQTFENIFVIGIERYIQTGLDRIKKIENNDSQEENIESIVEHDENDSSPGEEINLDKNDEQFNLELNNDGTNFILVNQRVDYEHRPMELSDVCLYEFVSKYKKKKKDKSDEKFLKDQEEDQILNEIDLETYDSLKKTRGRSAQKRYVFDEGHPQISTHILMERVKKVIPVLVGPQIPRKNREITQERYCRSILTLFFPWRAFTDLCSPDETWLESWTKNERYLSHTDVIENIELLHECKEQKNEHLVQLIDQLEDGNIEPPIYARLDDESESEYEVDEELSNILNMCDDSNNYTNKNDSDYINSAIDALSKINRFKINQEKNDYLISETEEIIKNVNDGSCIGKKKFNIKSLVPASHSLHQKNIEWQLLLKLEKEKRRKSILYGTSDENQNCNNSYQPLVNNKTTDNTLPEVAIRSIDVTTQELIIANYSLNEEQKRAFIIITDHLDEKSFLNTDGNRQEQLIMCVPASAGTGKSHLNKALTEYFKITDRLSILRKLAPTSVAANEMGEGGLTMQSFIHSRLSTNISQNRKSNIEMEWKHIKYIFFDEVSMVGLDTLAKLSRLMTLAKEDWADTSDPFGGKNIIFFGDLMQYKPIMDLPVYTDILKQGYELKNAKKIFKENIEEENKSIKLEEERQEQQKQEKTEAKKDKRQAMILPKINNSFIRKKVGRALWLQINVVVILKKQMRTTDLRLLDIQNRIREGKATKDDHNELRKRIVGIGNELESLAESPWNSAPVIVFRNDLRTCINNKAVEKFAKENNTPMIVCVASDKLSSASSKNKEISRYILSLDDSKTQGLPGYLPLVANMPVMLTRSLFTELGVSNGAIGIFKQLIYDDIESDCNEMIDKEKFLDNTIFIQKPLFALIELVKSDKLPNMQDLPPKLIPIALEEQEFTVDITKMLPKELRKRCIRAPTIKVKRKQFPLVPACGYTSHKAQGQTIPKAVLDINFPPPPFSKEIATAYVPLTRVKLMEDLAFSRDFPLSCLQIQPSKEQNKEIERLENLNAQTKKKFDIQYPNSK